MFITLDRPTLPLQLTLAPQSLTSANLTWIPPTDSLCVTSYTLNLTNITEGNVSYTYNTTTNTTSMTVSDLTQGVEYSFSVAGVEAGGRVGENSVRAELITLDSELWHTKLEITSLVSYITNSWFIEIYMKNKNLM